MTIAIETATGGPLDQLANVSGARDAMDLRERLATLGRWVRADLVEFEAELSVLPRGARVIQQAAHHLLERIRPVFAACVDVVRRDELLENERLVAVETLFEQPADDVFVS